MSCFSCQRLINLRVLLKADSQSHTHKELSPAYGVIQLCLWKAKFLPCLSAYRPRKIPPPWDAEDRIFSLSLLQPSTCSHSHFTHCLTISSPSCWLSQTSSTFLPGHTCRKKELGSALALPGARSMCYHGCEVPLRIAYLWFWKDENSSKDNCQACNSILMSVAFWTPETQPWSWSVFPSPIA